MTTGDGEELRELAAAYGVATAYDSWRGDTVDVPTATLVAVLEALGVDASTPVAVGCSLREARIAPWRRLLPATTVVRVGERGVVPVRGPEGAAADVRVEPEDGSACRDLRPVPVDVAPVEVDGVLVAEAAAELPEDLPLGWHRIHARCGDRAASAALVVVPDRAHPPEQQLHGAAWGLMVQLYSVRSGASWGIGDLSDLADVAELVAGLDAGFVLTNPLHAAEPVTPVEPSPYFPASRRFADPLYLRVEDIPECARLTGPGRTRVAELAEAFSRGNRGTELLDRDAAWQAKRSALELIYAVPRDPRREESYAAFREREGRALDDFATWCALAERHGLPWQKWPEGYHDPRSAAVAQARRELTARVDFYAWLQWLLDEQLAAAQGAARRAGMPLGIVHDLAVGVNPGGADAWMLGDTLARGVTGGAPPDAFNQQGQDWGQPPWRPDRLAETGYAPFRDMLRFSLRHGGGLRVDHILGLFRLWWIPEGAPASEGTYVHYDHEALVGILALEAHRAGALVVGEDLGTVQPWVRDYLSERGILGTSMVWFEDDGSGRPRPPEQWRELCLATVATHDMAPIAGYLAGEHIELRERLGLLARPVEEERADDEDRRRAWLDGLRERGLLPSEADDWSIVRALHAFLAATPAWLRAAALADAVGEHRTQNQPGTVDEYPNWRVPLGDGDSVPVLVEDLRGDTAAARGLREVAAVLRGDAP